MLLEALDDFPVHVFNLTTDDLHMWPDLSAANLSGTSIISTNLIPPDDRRGPLTKYAIQEVELGDGVVKIGFLGVADPKKVRPNSGFRAIDLEEAVGAIKAEVMEKADFLVVMGDLTLSQTERLAENHPEIFAILQLQRQYILPRARQLNNAVLLSSVERGRYLGQLEIEFDAEGTVASYEPELIQLNAAVPESPEMVAKVSKVQKRVK